MPDKKCPKCKLWNSETATICDCGYEFSSGRVRRDFAHSRPQKRKMPLDRVPSAWALAAFALGGVIFLFGLVFLTGPQSPFRKEWLILWVAGGAYYFAFLARDLWLGRRYRMLLPPDSPTTQARIIGRSTRKIMGEYGREILHELVIRFHPAEAPGAPQTLTLSAHVSPSTYGGLMHTDIVTIRYSRQDPRIVLIADEQ